MKSTLCVSKICTALNPISCKSEANKLLSMGTVWMKFYYMHICLHFVHACFYATVSEDSGPDRYCSSSKPAMSTVWPLTQNCASHAVNAHGMHVHHDN